VNGVEAVISTFTRGQPYSAAARVAISPSSTALPIPRAPTSNSRGWCDAIQRSDNERLPGAPALERREEDRLLPTTLLLGRRYAKSRPAPSSLLHGTRTSSARGQHGERRFGLQAAVQTRLLVLDQLNSWNPAQSTSFRAERQRSWLCGVGHLEKRGPDRAAAEWRPQADDRSTPVTIDESYRTGTPPSPPIGAPSEASTSWIPTSSSASAGGQLKTSDSGGQICTSLASISVGSR
jgi:hypothetical protein